MTHPTKAHPTKAHPTKAHLSKHAGGYMILGAWVAYFTVELVTIAAHMVADFCVLLGV